jgi:hypothetical protein
MSGTKTIMNSSPIAVSVVLRGRQGADPSGGSLPPVTATIQPKQSVTLRYGDDQNPYLNSLDVEENSNGSDLRQSFATTSRGGPGTLDNLFNANGTLVVAYNAASYSFGLTAHN